jgi:hypothetical protein
LDDFGEHVMTSHYLTEEAAVQRREALFMRLADEAVCLGSPTWLPDSDYWLLPDKEQEAVFEFTIERLVKS